jgi:hypothetical protein
MRHQYTSCGGQPVRFKPQNFCYRRRRIKAMVMREGQLLKMRGPTKDASPGVFIRSANFTETYPF